MTTRENTPIALDEALASFDALWSPRIVTRVNDYDVRVAKVEGITSGTCTTTRTSSSWSSTAS